MDIAGLHHRPPVVRALQGVLRRGRREPASRVYLPSSGTRAEGHASIQEEDERLAIGIAVLCAASGCSSRLGSCGHRRDDGGSAARYRTDSAIVRYDSALHVRGRRGRFSAPGDRRSSPAPLRVLRPRPRGCRGRVSLRRGRPLRRRSRACTAPWSRAQFRRSTPARMRPTSPSFTPRAGRRQGSAQGRDHRHGIDIRIRLQRRRTGNDGPFTTTGRLRRCLPHSRNQAPPPRRSRRTWRHGSCNGTPPHSRRHHRRLRPLSSPGDARQLQRLPDDVQRPVRHRDALGAYSEASMSPTTSAAARGFDDLLSIRRQPRPRHGQRRPLNDGRFSSVGHRQAARRSRLERSPSALHRCRRHRQRRAATTPPLSAVRPGLR